MNGKLGHKIIKVLARKAGLVIAAVVALSCSRSGNAQVLVIDPTIEVDLPDLTLQPDSSASFELFTQNSGTVRAVNGVAVAIQVAGLGPSITGVDVLANTIFQN